MSSDSRSIFLILTGYKLSSLKENETGLTARLSLIGPACNAFGRDISDLIVEITYETNTRCVHLNFNFFSISEPPHVTDLASMSTFSTPQTNNIRSRNLLLNAPHLLSKILKEHQIWSSTTRLHPSHFGLLVALTRVLLPYLTPGLLHFRKPQ